MTFLLQCPYESINEDVPIPPYPKQWDENEYHYIRHDHHINQNNPIRNGSINKNDSPIIEDNPIYSKSKDSPYAVSYDNIPGSSNRFENPYVEINDDFIRNCLEGNSVQGENINDNYSNLLKGKSYIHFRESNVLYSDIFKTRQGGVNISNLSKDWSLKAY